MVRWWKRKSAENIFGFEQKKKISLEPKFFVETAETVFNFKILEKKCEIFGEKNSKKFVAFVIQSLVAFPDLNVSN